MTGFGQEAAHSRHAGLSAAILSLLASVSPIAAGVGHAQSVAPVITAKKAESKAPATRRPASRDDSEIIVTGVLAATKAKKANASIAVMTAEDMSKFTPVSASDMLRDMPGVVVDSNEGVARGMIYTRGMSIGSDSPTTGNFWVSMLEDGLPILAVRFNGMQDGNFYRPDISTNRIEAVRGGSSGVTISTSAGGVFNFMSAPIRNGTAVQMRLGVEGDNPHLSWRQFDFIHGQVNKAGDFGYSISGFLRGSNGPAGDGLPYDLNSGGQVKARAFKSYTTSSGARGDFTLAVKYLNDWNAAMSNNVLPTYGYGNATPIPGYGRDADLYLHGGGHMVPLGDTGQSRYSDPQKGYHYRQDAIWLTWNHKTAGSWGFTGGIKYQVSSDNGYQGQWNGLVSLRDATTFSNAYNTGLTGNAAAASLNRTAGYFELYDLNSGTVQARIANNVGGSQLGVDYRTGQSCARVTSTTSPGMCVTMNNLPLASFDMRGGQVTNAAGVVVQVPATNATAATDVVQATRSEFVFRTSKDIIANFAASYNRPSFGFTAGLYYSNVRQRMDSWGTGFALSPYADGQVRNLGARFITTSGTTYQLTDSGGWGKLGFGPTGGGVSNTGRLYNNQTDIAPYLGLHWSPSWRWDFTGNVKYTYTNARTYAEQWVQNTASTLPTAASFGGLDGDPKTLYDNFYYTSPAVGMNGEHDAWAKNWSVSAGYNISNRLKVYFRHSDAENNMFGIIASKWATNPLYTNGGALANTKLVPQGGIKQEELGIMFSTARLSGQLSFFRNDNRFPFTSAGLDLDGSSYEYTLEGHYLAQGVELAVKTNPFKNFWWNSSVTYEGGKTLDNPSVNFGVQGKQDDVINHFSTNGVPKLPELILSNTFTYKWKDFMLNLRHRAMSKRYLLTSLGDSRYLPANSNVDLGVQYKRKNILFTLDVRNLMNSSYITGIDTLLPTSGSVVSGSTAATAGVTKVDIFNQLPNSASWVKINAARSFWLTVKYDF